MQTLSAPRILLVKTSSLGDVVHNLPVVSDIMQHFPAAEIDWLVEESFAVLPRLHPQVRKIIPIAFRRWRRQLLQASTWREIHDFRLSLAMESYDYVIDTQGLLKSAFALSNTQGVRCGFDRSSIREPLATFIYHQTFAVARTQHAVERNRQLAAHALGYELSTVANFGIAQNCIKQKNSGMDTYVVFLHATSRDDKLWDEANWIILGRHFQQKNIHCILPWGNNTEKLRSEKLNQQIPNSICPPKLNLNEIVTLLNNAYAVIGVDTGIAHLAAALNKPTIGIYTATNPFLTGLYNSARAINLGGLNQIPNPIAVLEALNSIIN